MCRRRGILLCVVVIFYGVVAAQTNISLSPLQILLHTKQATTINWRDKAISITDSPFNTFPQQLLKTKKGLYLFVNGSGRLYQLSKSGTAI